MRRYTETAIRNVKQLMAIDEQKFRAYPSLATRMAKLQAQQKKRPSIARITVVRGPGHGRAAVGGVATARPSGRSGPAPHVTS